MRPTDWSPLGLGSDPVPGEPGDVLAGGQSYLEVADAIGAASRRLRSIDLGSAVVSDAVDALTETAGKVAENIAKAEARYRATGEALVGYAPVLESAQTDSESALSLARAARQSADDATSTQRHYVRLAEDETDEQQAITYRNLADNSQADAADAHSTLASAQSQLTEATTARDRAAESAIDHIHNITKHDGLHDSWWDNWGKDLLSVITDVAGWVSAIAGVLALVVSWIPVVGQVLAAALLVVAGIAAIVNAIGNIVLASTGDRSWGEAIASIAGAVLSCVGMGAAAKGVGVLLKGSKSFAMKYGEQITVRQAMKISKGDWAKWAKDMRTPVPEPYEGQMLYRTYGGGSQRIGGSWAPTDPRALANPRMELGLPDVNTMDNVVTAELRDPSQVFTVRHALPYNGNLGGAPEYLIFDGVNKGIYTPLADVPFSVR
ncbi:hypothetical protein OSC27_12445 [Microbacterium sp. STN6]|uniref:putative T7SS-secreted protein n=1 Tax=Microbacterium sp. STN6 TaxID=2995588 RepID=UPI002260F65E|nr:hypothetical protein [Microbacterium sp. STN6]MCX7523081.1 hypothetical protein [Microbacterium sp. STN6]